VFDVRALLVGRDVQIGDGVYLERNDPPPAPLEETLRGWFAAIPMGWGRQARRFLERTNALETKTRALTDKGLREALQRVGFAVRKTGFTDESTSEAFALIREGTRRILKLRHHDVQLLAGRALLQGKIAEMATGEGKTLVATLAACTAAVSGASVHVVTVNDYLATRDAEGNAPLFTFFGLSIGIVKQDMPVPERVSQYMSDIVYVSNKELTFDYLKDRISIGGVLSVHQKLRTLQRNAATAHPILQGLHVAIVDEADSVLIDEARTPLIISETLPDDLGEDVYRQALAIAKGLQVNRDFNIGTDRDIWLTEVGLGTIRERVEADDIGTVWNSGLWQKELVQKALSALYSFHRDEHYIISEDKIQIVDEFTGRVMPDRTWERGLHQMIEAKEECEISGQRKTLSQITYQRFFRRYLLLAGMTGTAKEVGPEIKRVYDLSVSRIATHKPSRRVRLRDRVFANAEDHWLEVARRAQEIASTGRSVLVGTRSVEGSEMLSGLLKARGVEHAVLNARQDKTEAEDIGRAGEPGRITVATNMAGRGTDIKLAPKVAALGGLHVILTEFHESARIDRQLFGRSARQGDPGSVEAIVNLQDELFVRYVPDLSRRFSAIWTGRGRINAELFRLLVKYAQRKAEHYNRNIRIETIKSDRKWVQALGFVGSARK
jgi:preprotein translocase subunit SecA